MIASSNEGEVVLDPFCGCGTTIAAAQKLNRQWIGIDITHLAVGLQKLRLRDNFGMVPTGAQASRLQTPLAASKASGGGAADAGETPALQSYRVVGQPEDLEGAKELAEKDKYGFQWWILPLIGAKAYGSEAGKKEGKKGADKGVDGSIIFRDDHSEKSKRVIVSVKGGHNANVSHIRDLIGTIEREKAVIGVFLTLDHPSSAMVTEAADAGFYHSEGWNKDYPKIQILTVEDILAGKTVQLAPNIDTYKKAQKVGEKAADQGALSFGNTDDEPF